VTKSSISARLFALLTPQSRVIYKLFCNFAAVIKKNRIMESTTAIAKSRTREEILAWLQQAKERKDAFQRRVNEEWEARQRSKQAAAETGYYDIEWV
jgi:predicted Fe-S protein YdhL (DUF1289 family)